MRRKLAPALLFTGGLSLVVATPTEAAQYAAMKNVPVKGGELRLKTPVKMTVRGADGTSRKVRAIAFPLKRTRVKVLVAGMMALYRVEQIFHNPFTQPIEAVYVFPLGDESAVSSYRIVIGERVIQGKIKKREEARRIYRRAKHRGHTAGLLEQVKGNVFSQRIANIAPKETVKVRFEYVELVTTRDNRYELVFPTVVGPRYLPAEGAGSRPVGSHAAGSSGRPGVTSIPYVRPGTPGMPRIEITVHVDAGVPIRRVVSPSHHIQVKRHDATTVTVSLTKGKALPNRDFILRYRPKGKRTAVGILAHRRSGPGFFVLMVQPKAKYRTGDIAPREVILLIDKSGSMDGAPMRHAKAVARGLIAALKPKDRFNIIAFANGVSQLSRTPIQGDRTGRERGLRWLAALQAGGGTELEHAVLRTLKTRPGADRIRAVYVLTDGYVGNDKVILAAARRHLAHNRIFPIGVGSAPNRFLLNRLAEVGRGFASYVTLREKPRQVLARLLRRTTHPYLTDVKIHWGGLSVFDVEPRVLPDVYAGLPLVVSGRYRRAGKGVVRIQATTAGRRVGVCLTVGLPVKHVQKPVAFLWARKKIRRLMETNYGKIPPTTRQAITRIGLWYGLVTAFTSYVAVDQKRVVKRNGVARTVTQPAPMPEGVSFDTSVGSGGSRGSTYAPPSPHVSSSGSYRSSGHRTSRWSNRGGRRSGYSGGGDTDPLTLLLVMLLIPTAWATRRKKGSA